MSFYLLQHPYDYRITRLHRRSSTFEQLLFCARRTTNNRIQLL